MSLLSSSQGKHDVESDSENNLSSQSSDDDSRFNDSGVESEASSDSESEEEEPALRRKRKHDETEDEPATKEEFEATRVRVLSHAEKRRQKREEQKKLKAQPESTSKKRKKSTDVLPTGSAKRQNSVWVGNLSFKTTADDLRTFFAGVGEITRVNMPTKLAPPGLGRRTPENQGFAYVDFTTPEAKSSAIAMSEQPLIGRKLLIKDGDDFSGRPQPGGDAGTLVLPTSTLSKTAKKILRAQKQPPGPTLFLGNLGFETTEANILEMLAAHRSTPTSGKNSTSTNDEGKSSDGGAEASGKTKAKAKDKDKDGTKEGPTATTTSATTTTTTTSTRSWVRKVRMGTFEDSGLCKGFAFVDFVSAEEAMHALVNPKNYFLNGRKLVVEYASPDAVRRGAPKRPTGKPPVDKERKLGRGPKFSQEAKVEADEDNAAMESKIPEQERPYKRQRMDKADKWTGQKRGPKSRAKPGAALASAQRASAAIIPSEGRKIKFS